MKWSARTIPELIIEVWEALDCESVGALELERIQHALREAFGEGGAASPASIARTVADEGAVLRHPEVFDCDLKWRRSRLEAISFPGIDFSNLSAAFESVVKIEQKRLVLQSENDTAALARLRELVATHRSDLSLKAGSKILKDGEREQAKEVSEWLKIWLQAPELFSDWLDLRRDSTEFQKKFDNA